MHVLRTETIIISKCIRGLVFLSTPSAVFWHLQSAAQRSLGWFLPSSGFDGCRFIALSYRMMVL